MKAGDPMTAVNPAGSRVFRARGAGRWFSAEAAALGAQVDGALEQARTTTRDTRRVVAAVAPHAGFLYSGGVAGHTYQALREAARASAPDLVVVLGFCHRESLPGVALLAADVVRTPLGDAPLLTEAGVDLCAASPGFHWDSRPHAGEHSAENQVPFLQRALPGVPLVLGLFGEQTPDLVRAVVAGLVTLARRYRLVVVASTDLLHDADRARVERSDARTLAQMESMDVAGLWQSWSPAHQVCCGIGPVTAAIGYAAAQGCAAGRLLAYRHSADVAPDADWVVGYGSVVYPAPAHS